MVSLEDTSLSAEYRCNKIAARYAVTCDATATALSHLFWRILDISRNLICHETIGLSNTQIMIVIFYSLHKADECDIKYNFNNKFNKLFELQ